jgi:hypothetical protein
MGGLSPCQSTYPGEEARKLNIHESYSRHTRAGSHSINAITSPSFSVSNFISTSNVYSKQKSRKLKMRWIAQAQSFFEAILLA